MLTKLDSLLQGKKTYLVVLATLVYAGAGWYLHYLTPKEAMDLLLAALGAGAFRSALTKVGK